MELGNLLFGNSRGKYQVPRYAGWEDEFYRLIDAIGGEIVEFENNTFWIFPYCEKVGAQKRLLSARVPPH